ncbi:MAG TPA: ATP-grasp domain-containing protein [Bacteroidota bacterium]
MISTRPPFQVQESNGTTNNSILVTGIGGPAGKAATAFLRGRGLKVIGTDIHDINDHAGEFHLVPRGDDPQFGTAMIELLRHTRPFLVIPTVSEELPPTSRIRNRILNVGARVFISDPVAVDIANDKLITMTELGRCGIPIPQTASGVDAKTAGKKLGYPLLVKPRVSRGGRGVLLYQEESEVTQERRTDVVWQEFMPGEEYDLNLFAYPVGQVRSLVVLQKTLMKQGIVGNALSVQRVDCSDVAELGYRVAKILGLEGPIDMDIRRDRNGVPKLLEINARLGANVLAASEILESLLITAEEGVFA